MGKIKKFRKKTWPISIHGDRWRFQLLSEAQFIKEIGEEDVAVCKKAEKRLVFQAAGLNFGTVIHELFHAYCVYLFLDSTSDVERHDYEEIYAEMLDHYWPQMDRQARWALHLMENTVKQTKESE